MSVDLQLQIQRCIEEQSVIASTCRVLDGSGHWIITSGLDAWLMEEAILRLSLHEEIQCQ